MLAASILLTPGTEVSGRNKAEKTETVAVKTEKTAKTEKNDAKLSDQKAKESSKKTESQPKEAAKETSVSKASGEDASQKKASSTASSSSKADEASSSKSGVAETKSTKTESAEKTVQQKTQSVEPKPKFTIPRAQNNATLVFIFDDAGLNVEYTKKYATLPFPVTIAVLPKLSHTKECAEAVRNGKKELILHQPMQSMNLKLNPGPGKISAEMGAFEIMQTVRENLDELGPDVKGMNNHEGSLITSDVLKIGFVMDVCDERGIYFLDSRTTAETKAPQAALERGTEFYEKNAPYIDNVISYEAMRDEIYRCLDVANKKGTAIMIGHVDKSAAILPSLLNEMYPFLVEKGYSFATPGTLKR